MELWMLCDVLALACLLLSSGRASGKECTNTGVSQSHTLRYKLWTSKNRTLETELFPHHLHLNPTEESTWMGLIPRKVLRDDTTREEFDWAMLYRRMQGTEDDTSVGRDFLKDLSLHDVRLGPDSVHWRAQQTNLEYLLLLDVDQLVWSFRKQAGLPTPGKPYGGWEGSEVELRGHFVGHYMSATAKMWASTHNDTLNQKMSTLVDALDVCQKKIGTGYLSAFPTELFDRFEALTPVWAPYYTIHKIMAGLVDQYLYAGNNQALQMVIWMAEYFGDRVKNVITRYTIERHYASLNEETGGMNDVLYKLYTITKDQKHLVLAHLFDKPCFLGMLAVQADSISGFHANTHIPVIIGAQKRYEVTGDQLYKEIGTYFMDVVNSSHSYATGGTSFGEFWSDPKRLADTLRTENQESCTTYNMLKVSRNLFRWTKEMGYADYYERSLTNSVLGIQRGTDPGVMIYMLPMGVGVSKARSYHGWGTQFNSFWCCYGTGIESFSKLGDSIYFEQDSDTPSLYVIQYISSSVNWKSGGIVLHQKVENVASFDPCLRVTVTFSLNKSVAQSSKLMLRIPFWTSSKDAKATLNDESVDIPAPGNFLTVTRQWTPSDKLTLQLPIILRTQPIQDDRPQYASVQAILFGPYVLAGLSKGNWDIKAWDTSATSEWIEAVPSDYNSQLDTLTQEFDEGHLVLSNSNHSIAMEAVPSDGTDAAIHATFRAVLVDPPANASGASPEGGDILPGSLLILEPLDLPGMVVADDGPNGNLAVSSRAGPESTFRLVPGLDGKRGTVSLESATRPGCFVRGAEGYSPGERVRVGCREDAGIHGGSPAASFTLRRGIRPYHPVSFVARGPTRNLLLEPLSGLRDESYTVYFKFGA